ncbi:MAG TPA: SDR family oxidoreductase [Patescibacteria group bacterium]|nr:SDR family oxidoreductase [Patescibacteria group bacterium]
MKKVLLFGATGHLGKEVAKELLQQGYDVTAAVRNEAKAQSLSGITNNHVVVDVCKPQSFTAIKDNFEIVVSALGKSVSPNDKSKPTFKDVDLDGNTNILNFAKEKGCKKFVYVSALHSEKYQHLEYFKVHHEFSERLMQSGIDYSIIKPPAIFSAFLDIIEMAKKGQLVNIGKGDKKTNPIYEGDLAKVVVDSITTKNAVIEAGGKTIYTRKQLNEIVNAEVKRKKKVPTIPIGLFKAGLPVIRLFDKNAFDKFAFFIEVMQHDTLAPQVGEMTFEKYIRQKVNS